MTNVDEGYKLHNCSMLAQTTRQQKLNPDGEVKGSFWHRLWGSFRSVIVPKNRPDRGRGAEKSVFTRGLDLTKRFWHRMLDSVGSVMIRTKIMGIVTLGFIVSILVILGVAWQAYRDTAHILREQLQEHSIAIGTTLALYAGEPSVSGDRTAALGRLAADVCKAEKDVVYVLVIGAGGTDVVRTSDEDFTGIIPAVNRVPAGQTYHIQTRQNGRDTIHDVAVPIPGEPGGLVRVGITEASITSAGMEHLRQMLILAAAISVLWLVIAYSLSSILVRPVHRLLEAIRTVEGDHSRSDDPLVTRKDEISRLGVTFGVMNRELQRREEIRKQLLNKVINAQEEERKRIARELHDQTGQSLTSLIVGLKVLESHNSGEGQKRIADLKQLATAILGEIHNLALDLRPSSLDDLGLIAALRQYTKEYAAKFGIETDFQANGLDEKRLPPATEIALYRIIQEALTNIVKHAAATKVSVLIASRGNKVVAIVEDNGKGFDVERVFVASKSDHKLGLYGMQERASLIGGVLTIESTWMGTAVFVEAPLEETGGK